jgi:hypothetical protein
MTRADVHRELIAIAKDGLRDPEAATVIGEEQSHAGDLARAALRTFELAFRRIG